MATALGAVTNAILVALRAGVELSDVTIEDATAISSRAWKVAVIVGDDGDPESDAESSFTQAPANLDGSRRVEIGEIVCAAIAQSGSTTVETQRTRALSLLTSACEAAINVDPTLGGIVFNLEVISGSARTIQNEKGSAVTAPFIVRYWTHVER